jgi:hypothetical protein
MSYLWPHLRFGFAIAVAAIFSLATAHWAGDAQKCPVRSNPASVELSGADSSPPQQQPPQRDRLADIDRD